MSSSIANNLEFLLALYSNYFIHCYCILSIGYLGGKYGYLYRFLDFLISNGSLHILPGSHSQKWCLIHGGVEWP
jgi:hypothetical protein